MRLPGLLLLIAYGIPDRGIYPELAGEVAAAIPPGIEREHTWLRIDPVHRVVTLYDGDDPVKAYPATLRRPLTKPLLLTALGLRPQDRAELDRALPAAPRLVVRPTTRRDDRDDDGIVDRLDIFLGAKKLLGNHARYIERYVELPYPGGDVPRTEGVCSDTVVRALRNAGIDLQKEVHEDILREAAAYPMVEQANASINHRRVRTLLPWFKRHFATLPPGARYLPGDVVFFDTIPSRDGPDHLGIVGDVPGRTGAPLVINNWTVGSEDAEMDLLAFVPVTHHFRAR
jgi:uncharacterized protein YijF (DUF1287 family)